MTRPIRWVGAVATAMALIITSCGTDKADKPDGTDSTSCPVDAFKKAAGRTEVILWHSYVGKTRQTLEKLAADYTASQKKVKVTVEAQGNSYGELLRKYQAALPSKKLPAITIGEDIDTQTMVDSKSVLPAQDCMDADSDPRAHISDILPAFTSDYTVDGKLYPATFNGSTIMLYFNKEHFRKAGLDPEKPPTTLDEVYADAVKLKAAKVSDKPFVMKMDSWFLEHWVTGAHETIVDHDNGRKGLAEKATWDNPAAHTVYAWLAKMNDAGLLNAVGGEDAQINHYLAMATQSSSMLIETSTAITTVNGVIDGTFNAADLGQENNPDVTKFNGIKIALDIGVGLNPGITDPGKGQVGGGAWYITNTNSPAVESAAWDFVKWFNEKPQQVQWTLEGSYLPIMKSVKDDPAVVQEFATTRRGKWLATAYQGLTTLDPKFTGPVIGPYTKTREAIRKSVESMLSNGTAPDAAIKQANDAITKALKDYKDSNF